MEAISSGREWKGNSFMVGRIGVETRWKEIREESREISSWQVGKNGSHT